MTDDQNDQKSEITPELTDKLQQIKDRCLPPAGISWRAYYLLLLFCSFIVYVSYRMIHDAADWDSMRFAHGLLPIDVLMMRNAMVPWLIPAVIIFLFVLAHKFKSLRSPVFLAWFTLVIFGLVAAYSWVSGLFAFHLLNRLAP
ncbi:MAG: hypothetical protein PHD82_15430 [Candidatus Riflebacteria bacterium]|nr:hypothetical protein [Candidatus Riflebacteria bacterium]